MFAWNICLQTLRPTFSLWMLRLFNPSKLPTVSTSFPYLVDHFGAKEEVSRAESKYSSVFRTYFVRLGLYSSRYHLPLLAESRNCGCSKQRFRKYEERCGIVTGQIEKSIVALLDIDCNSPQTQKPRSFLRRIQRV